MTKKAVAEAALTAQVIVGTQMYLNKWNAKMFSSMMPKNIFRNSLTSNVFLKLKLKNVNSAKKHLI